MVKNKNKRKKGDCSSSTDLSNLSELLDNISKDDNLLEHAVSLIMEHQSFRNAITGKLSTEISLLNSEISHLKQRMDDMEQYSRRTCLKISGIKENGKFENTDNLVLDVINDLILPNTGRTLTLEHIGRTHRIGKPNSNPNQNSRPRDIIIRFLSYRDRALVYANKKNLKAHNSDPKNKFKLYVNEALTQQRAKLYRQTRDLFKEGKIGSCWTFDGKILVKTHDDRTVHVTNEADLEQFLKIRINTTVRSKGLKPQTRANASLRLNASAISFVPQDDKAVTSTPQTLPKHVTELDKSIPG